MFKNLKLRNKLLLAFGGVALITLLVGLVGFWGALQSEHHIDELGTVRMPSVESLMIIKDSAQSVRGTMRTLTIPGIDPALRQRQYDNLANTRVTWQAAWDVYEPLPQTREEAAVWQQFVPAWNAWREENNRFIELSREFDRNGITYPADLARRLEQFTKDHYIVVNRTRDLLDDPQAHFEGGDDHTACNAGRYMPTFQTTNASLQGAIRAFEAPHRQFHESVGRIKRLVGEGRADEARALYQGTMVPAMQTVFRGFDGMLATANESMELRQQAADMALGTLIQRQRTAMEHLDKLVQINQEVADQEVAAAHSEADFIKAFSLIAMFVGVVIALGLGVLIARAITTPIIKAVGISNQMSKGDLTVEIEVDSKDETGQLLGAMKNMLEKLRAIVADVQSAAENVSSGSQELSSSSEEMSQGATEQAASAEEASSSMEQMAANIKQNADNATRPKRSPSRRPMTLRTAARPSPHRGGHEGDRPEDLDHRGDRPPDRPSGPQRRHRGGARRRARQGVCRGGLRGAQAGRAQPDGGRRDQQPVGLQRRGGRKGRRDAEPHRARHPEDGRTGSGDQRGQQRAEHGCRPGQQGHSAARPGDPAERLGVRRDGLDLRGALQPGRTAAGNHRLL
jgi:methyl-accepting chemotaxis protein